LIVSQVCKMQRPHTAVIRPFACSTHRFHQTRSIHRSGWWRKIPPSSSPGWTWASAWEPVSIRN
jgi:hypothetical protein